MLYNSGKKLLAEFSQANGLSLDMRLYLACEQVLLFGSRAKSGGAKRAKGASKGPGGKSCERRVSVVTLSARSERQLHSLKMASACEGISLPALHTLACFYPLPGVQ